jgi:hypothetical protein
MHEMKRMLVCWQMRWGLINLAVAATLWASPAHPAKWQNHHAHVACLLLVGSQVKSIAEMGAYVSLLEYNGIEGMILLSELSRRRIRSITKLIKVRAWLWGSWRQGHNYLA